MKFGTSEINDESKGRYDNSNSRFKATTISSSLCDYSDAYILAMRAITVPNTTAAGAAESAESLYLVRIQENTDQK